MTAFEVNQYPCGCYTRCADGRWSTNPHCKIHNVQPSTTIVPCKACGGTGVKRTLPDYGTVCTGCKGAGVHRL